MKLLRFRVQGLFGKDNIIDGDFSPDINILTGRNGAGKTSLLKLIWYVISGNILIALKEVNFRMFHIETDIYECTVIRISELTCKIELVIDGKKRVFQDDTDDLFDELSSAEDQANPLLIAQGSSVFFPTFRRIEGGFTLESRRLPSGRIGRTRNDVEEALLALSRRLSNEPHIFVSAISTVDVVSLLLRQYADLSERSNSLQQRTSQEIINSIKNFKSDAAEQENLFGASGLLDEIRSTIESMEEDRERVMTPLNAVKNLVEKLFWHSGIKISANLSFGDAANAINSDALSAGEKQMLSFICYNAFYKDSVVLIDEPELSLHVDWQRQLFQILQGQQSSNQFIVATHSPFIYSKYPDKEICLDSDRGYTDNR